ncbi:MAG: phosphatase family protein [Thermoleophilia bacterium]|nr:phosphatase family protein [Thermoleophilia bacterium]
MLRHRPDSNLNALSGIRAESAAAASALAAFTRNTGMQVSSPPSNDARRLELAQVHALTDARTPGLDATAVEFDERGGWRLWQQEAKEYREHAGFLPGIFGTLRMDAAIGVAALKTSFTKRQIHAKRPYELDPSIAPLGPRPADSSFPSGHAVASMAAATVLSHLWPERRAHYENLAASVRWARVYSGVHFPSDVLAGAAVGKDAGSWFVGTEPTFT